MDSTDFYLGIHNVFIICKGVDAVNDDVYLNVSSLWYICNVLRNMEAGWLLQLSSDATFNVCRHTVALYSFSVNISEISTTLSLQKPLLSNALQ